MINPTHNPYNPRTPNLLYPQYTLEQLFPNWYDARHLINNILPKKLFFTYNKLNNTLEFNDTFAQRFIQSTPTEYEKDMYYLLDICNNNVLEYTKEIIQNVNHNVTIEQSLYLLNSNLANLDRFNYSINNPTLLDVVKLSILGKEYAHQIHQRF